MYYKLSQQFDDKETINTYHSILMQNFSINLWASTFEFQNCNLTKYQLTYQRLKFTKY